MADKTTDKCASHDTCIGRIHSTVDTYRDDLAALRGDMHVISGGIKEMLHQGEILHTKILMRLDKVEEEVRQLKASSGENDAIHWNALAAGMLVGLLEKGIIVILAMAYYGSKNGWGG